MLLCCTRSIRWQLLRQSVTGSRVRAARLSQHPLTFAGQALSPEPFDAFLPPLPQPLDWYHVTISYRQKTEKRFAQQLFDALAQFEAGAGQPIRCFLDQERLQIGQRWDLTVRVTRVLLEDDHTHAPAPGPPRVPRERPHRGVPWWTAGARLHGGRPRRRD